jgi:hypothetical protein
MGSGAISAIFLPGVMDDAFAEQVEAGPAVHLSLEGFEPVDVSFGGSGAVGQAEPGGDGREVLADPGSESVQLGWSSASTCSSQPGRSRSPVRRVIILAKLVTCPARRSSWAQCARISVSICWPRGSRSSARRSSQLVTWPILSGGRAPAGRRSRRAGAGGNGRRYAAAAVAECGDLGVQQRRRRGSTLSSGGAHVVGSGPGLWAGRRPGPPRHRRSGAWVSGGRAAVMCFRQERWRATALTACPARLCHRCHRGRGALAGAF